jgi:hypothetical protein
MEPDGGELRGALLDLIRRRHSELEILVGPPGLVLKSGGVGSVIQDPAQLLSGGRANAVVVAGKEGNDESGLARTLVAQLDSILEVGN